MLNQVIIVGRIKEIKESKKGVAVTLIIPQSFKNESGEYENNYIDVMLYKNVAQATKEYCKIGDMVGIKGRLQKLEDDKNLLVISDRVTFLSQRKDNEE